jgi:hypothetical protein
MGLMWHGTPACIAVHLQQLTALALAAVQFLQCRHLCFPATGSLSLTSGFAWLCLPSCGAGWTPQLQALARCTRQRCSRRRRLWQASSSTRRPAGRPHAAAAAAHAPWSVWARCGWGVVGGLCAGVFDSGVRCCSRVSCCSRTND